MRGVTAWPSVDLDLQVWCSACVYIVLPSHVSDPSQSLLAVRLELKLDDVNFYGTTTVVYYYAVSLDMQVSNVLF